MMSLFVVSVSAQERKWEHSVNVGIGLALDNVEILTSTTQSLFALCAGYGLNYYLNNNEFKICILRRLDFTPKTIAYMLNLSPSSITKIRNNMSKKLFGEEDNSKEFDKMLKQLS